MFARHGNHLKQLVFRCMAHLGLVCGLLSPMGLAAAPEMDLRAALADETVAEELSFRAILQGFYQARGFSPVWYRPDAAEQARERLIDTLLAADREGLWPQDYLADRLSLECRTPAMAERARCELLLGEALLRYGRDLGHGRHDPAALDTQWHIRNVDFEAEALLTEVASAEALQELLAALPPPHPAYARLREALAFYRHLADLGGWPLIGEGPTLRPGMVHGEVIALRRRLAMEFPRPALPVASMHYDPALEVAVRRFQHSRGLDVDGLVGPRTRRALSLPVGDLVAQIRVNMERWRWMPRQLGRRHLLVNVPAFELYLIEDGRELIRMRAITGRSDRSSPSFDSRVSKVVFNPDWTIPLIIAVEDLLPKQQRDADYLASRNIQVLRSQGGRFVEVDAASIDWRPYHKDYFPFVLRQAPGPRNSLGQIKFLMPNPFDIYLHDTPAKALFRKSVRTLSSGCIRLQQPLQLATALLAPGGEVAEHRYRALMARGETQVHELPVSVPVYLVYLTSWVEADGERHFHDDVYGRDRIMVPVFRDLD